jgi:hypothetical protein
MKNAVLIAVAVLLLLSGFAIFLVVQPEVAREILPDVFFTDITSGDDRSGKHDAVKCKSNLKAIYEALTSWKTQKGKGRFYPRERGINFVLALKKSKLLPDECFFCSRDASGRKPDDSDYDAIDNSKGSKTSIQILANQLKTPANRIPVVWDNKSNHGDKRHVLFLDGQIKLLSEVEFQELCQEVLGKSIP